MKYLNRGETREEDEDDKFFQSMAAECKKLPTRMRSSVRLKIHQLIHDAQESSYGSYKSTTQMSSVVPNPANNQIVIPLPDPVWQQKAPSATPGMYMSPPAHPCDCPPAY